MRLSCLPAPQAFLLLCVATRTALAATSTTSAPPFPLPSVDPFYSAPPGFESAAPGTVFKDRPTRGGWNEVTTTQVLYRTTYNDGSPGVTVATIIKAANASSSKLVLYTEPDTSLNMTCARSYHLNSDPVAEAPSMLKAGIAHGWTIVMTDYNGLNSCFAVRLIYPYQTNCHSPCFPVVRKTEWLCSA